MLADPHVLSAATWPTPTALKGVKSRSKTIFKSAGGTLAIDDRVVKFSALTLTGESRILAVGEGGRALTRLLLSREGNLTGEALHVADIVIVHLGPHLVKADPAACSRDDYAHAVLATLQKKPNIVILDEALFSGSESWLQLFDDLMGGDAIKSFKGAVVACVEKEPESLQLYNFCERWSRHADGELQQENIVKSKLEVIDDAVVACAREASDLDVSSRRAGREALRTGSDVEALMEEARELSEYCFEEDIVEAARRDRDTVTLLCERTPDGSRSLRGYLCYRYYPAPRLELHISRLAVSRQQRGRGLARTLMNWLLSRAARSPQASLSLISLGALESAVAFYARLGFSPAEAREPPKEGSDPQTWMELANESTILQCANASSLSLGSPPLPMPLQSKNKVPEADAPKPSTPGSAPMSMREAKDLKKRILDIEKRMKASRKKDRVDDEEMVDLRAELEQLKAELTS